MLVFKFEVITALENGMKPGQAAKKFDVPPSSVNTIIKNKEQIKRDFLSNKCPTVTKHVPSSYAQIEQILYQIVAMIRQTLNRW
jgi:transposase